jgi:hypothetical protein
MRAIAIAAVSCNPDFTKTHVSRSLVVSVITNKTNTHTHTHTHARARATDLVECDCERRDARRRIGLRESANRTAKHFENSVLRQQIRRRTTGSKESNPAASDGGDAQNAHAAARHVRRLKLHHAQLRHRRIGSTFARAEVREQPFAVRYLLWRDWVAVRIDDVKVHRVRRRRLDAVKSLQSIER